MATVKIKLRPSSVEGKAGVIFYQITHNRKTQHITTRLRVQPFDWNADKEKLEPSAPNRSMIQNCIDCDVALLRSLISNLDTCRMNYSVNDIISRYKSPQNHILVLDYMRMQIEQLRTANRLGTAKNYEKTMCSFGEFLGDIKLPLPAMTEQVIAAYNVFLIRRGLVRNSVSFYMRVLRAVYNKSRTSETYRTNPSIHRSLHWYRPHSKTCRSRVGYDIFIPPRTTRRLATCTNSRPIHFQLLHTRNGIRGYCLPTKVKLKKRSNLLCPPQNGTTLIREN